MYPECAEPGRQPDASPLRAAEYGAVGDGPVGFTLVELLVALVVVALIFGAALAMVVPAASGFRTVPEHVDVQQRLRTAADALRADVTTALAGAAVGPHAAASAAWPVVRPCGWTRDPVSAQPSPCARSDVMTLALPDRPLQVVTAAPATGTEAVVVSRPPGCPPGATGCQFVAGDRVIVSDGYGAADPLEVTWVSGGADVLGHGGNLPVRYEAGSTVASARTRTYYARPDADTGMLQLRRIDGESDLPHVDHITQFVIEYLGDPEPPRQVVGSDGRQLMTYGPPPRHTASASAGALSAIPTCAVDVIDGVAVSRLLPLRADADGLARLDPAILSDGPWCPDAAAPTRYDADLFRLRRLRITLRTDAGPDDVRGSDGGLFARPGSGTGALRLVPGICVRLDLAVRGPD